MIEDAKKSKIRKYSVVRLWHYGSKVESTHKTKKAAQKKRKKLALKNKIELSKRSNQWLTLQKSRLIKSKRKLIKKEKVNENRRRKEECKNENKKFFKLLGKT